MKYRVRSAYLLCAAGILVAVLACAGIVRAQGSTVPEIGKPAPEFTLKDVTTGNSTALSALLQGKKAIVVMFIATRCPVSNAYNDRMVALAQRFGPDGAAFVGINSNQTEPASECATHAQLNKFPFPVLKDPDSSVADQYGARCTPTVYVITAGGKLAYHGRIDNNMDVDEVTTHDLADALTSVLAGKPVAQPETKAFGCSIKKLQ
ncbi:MAG: thioredoxin family protein [Capsulimonadaceae bacterium]